MSWLKTTLTASAILVLLTCVNVSAAPVVAPIDPNFIMVDPNFIDPNLIVPSFTFGNVQQAVIPYATVSEGWASGLSVYNRSAYTVYYQVGFYLADGSYVSGIKFSLPPNGSITDTLTNFAGTGTISGTVAVYIRTLNLNYPFDATMFVGSSTLFQGFAFQNYPSSEQYLILINDPD